MYSCVLNMNLCNSFALVFQYCAISGIWEMTKIDHCAKPNAKLLKELKKMIYIKMHFQIRKRAKLTYKHVRWWIQVSSIWGGFSGSCSILTPNEQTSYGNSRPLHFCLLRVGFCNTVTTCPHCLFRDAITTLQIHAKSTISIRNLRC